MQVKVKSVDQYNLVFESGHQLYSDHVQSCCENHYLNFNDIELSDFEDLEFDLSTDDFFERIAGYGIALKPVHGHPVRIPGYASNNGYYSSNLTLVLWHAEEGFRKFDITECQDY